MLEKRNKSDILMQCNHCFCDIYIPKKEWNKQNKRNRNYFYCSLKCFGLKNKIDKKTEFAKCHKCNVEFSRFILKNKKKQRKYCSTKCANSRNISDFTKEKISNSVSKFMKNWISNNPEKWIERLENNNSRMRRSSKAERELAKLLGDNFKRHLIVKFSDIIFDVDIRSIDKKIWIESDGEWHFRKIHENHDFEKIKLRDQTEENCALHKNILLIRVDNQQYSLQDQLKLVLEEISKWDYKTGKVVKIGNKY